jgi:hypothetical protein
MLVMALPRPENAAGEMKADMKAAQMLRIVIHRWPGEVRISGLSGEVNHV